MISSIIADGIVVGSGFAVDGADIGIIGIIKFSLSHYMATYTYNINNGTVNGEPGNDSNAIGWDERNSQ